MATHTTEDPLGSRDQQGVIAPLQALINGRLSCENALQQAEENLQQANERQQRALTACALARASLAEYNQWLHRQGLHSHTTGAK